MQCLRARIHFGWVGGAVLAMTLAYFATGAPTLLASNAANDASTIPTVTEPPQPTIPPTTVTPRPHVDTDAPTPAEIDVMIGEAQDQAEQAKEDAQKQADESRRQAEQQQEDAQRQADEASAAHPH